ncbi:hypothetical protein Bbelb_067580 [Branchiostoma belcheri]|nr:hypothetical protein Bbelb_067580 [Branchiostoma belcheri]
MPPDPPRNLGARGPLKHYHQPTELVTPLVVLPDQKLSTPSLSLNHTEDQSREVIDVHGRYQGNQPGFQEFCLLGPPAKPCVVLFMFPLKFLFTCEAPLVW